MEFITYIMIAMAVVSVIDRIFGNKLGLGAEFEKGIMMLGYLTLSMLGMLVMAPLLAHLFGLAADKLPLFFDFSIIPASLLANDMGGAHLALELSEDPAFGYFNGLVVASMMGCTVSFTIPFALQVTPKEHHKDILLGILCGIVTLPLGCIISGVIVGINLISLITNLVPLILFAAAVAIGLLKFESFTIKAFTVLGFIIKFLISVGLIVGIIEFLTGKALLPYVDTVDNAMDIIVNIACIMTGAFPLLFVIKKLLNKLLVKFGAKLGINDVSAFGFLATLGTTVTTFEIMSRMDRKGIVLNSAFTVSASVVFVDHLAFTLTFNPDYVLAMIAAKLISGISAVVLAYFVFEKKNKPADLSNPIRI